MDALSSKLTEPMVCAGCVAVLEAHERCDLCGEARRASLAAVVAAAARGPVEAPATRLGRVPGGMGLLGLLASGCRGRPRRWSAWRDDANRGSSWTRLRTTCRGACVRSPAPAGA